MVLSEGTANESSGIKAAAEALARDPALLFKVKKALDQAIIGEDQSKLLLFLICCTSLGNRPLGAIITGESSAGKSWLEYYEKQQGSPIDAVAIEVNKVLKITPIQPSKMLLLRAKNVEQR